jgi:hypothetical protein
MIRFSEFHFSRLFILPMYATAAFLLIVALSIHSNNIMRAFAHETYRFGNISLTPGWQIEPPLVDQLNSIEINVTRNEAGNSVPIRNAFSELDASIKSGGLTKTVDFEPQEESVGLYRAKIIPTQVGGYSLLLIGKVEGQSIDSELRIEDVEDTAKFGFPLYQSQGLSDSSPSSIAPGQTRESAELPDSSARQQLQQLSPLISDLTNQINSSNDTASRAERVAEETKDKLEQLRGPVDRIYVLGLVSLGLGISGIVIGAFALTKGWDRQEVFKRK